MKALTTIALALTAAVCARYGKPEALPAVSSEAGATTEAAMPATEDTIVIRIPRGTERIEIERLRKLARQAELELMHQVSFPATQRQGQPLPQN